MACRKQAFQHTICVFFLPLLDKLIEDIEDPLFERDEAYFLSGEEQYEERLRKLVRFAKIRQRLGEDSDFDWPKYGCIPLSSCIRFT